ncbi:MAG: Spy/CpxP family protein refolding chaperone [bacterium]
MKALRIAALGFALVVGGSVVASAQGAGTQQQGRGNRPDQRLKDITLTAEQQAKIEEINKKYQPEMQVIRESMQGGGDRTEGMKKMNELRTKMQPEIRAILTPEQQAIFDKNVTEMKARMDAMPKQAPPAI